MIHLLITNGPQHRDFILDRTIEICENYFDSIRIFQNGGNPNSEKVDECVISRTKDFTDFITCQDILKDGIPEGDWIFALDSDERPTQEILSSLDELQKSDYNTISFPFKHHSITNEGKMFSVCGNVNGFRSARMFKVIPGLHSTVAWSAHFGYAQATSNLLQDNLLQHDGFINHFKHHFATLLSTLSFGLSLPDSIGVTPEMEEYSIIQEIKNLYETNVISNNTKLTPASVYLNYCDRYTWIKIKPIADKLKDSPTCNLIPQAVDFLINNQQSLKTLYRHENCGLDCCKYIVQY